MEGVPICTNTQKGHDVCRPSHNCTTPQTQTKEGTNTHKKKHTHTRSNRHEIYVDFLLTINTDAAQFPTRANMILPRDVCIKKISCRQKRNGPQQKAQNFVFFSQSPTDMLSTHLGSVTLQSVSLQVRCSTICGGACSAVCSQDHRASYWAGSRIAQGILPEIIVHVRSNRARACLFSVIDCFLFDQSAFLCFLISCLFYLSAPFSLVLVFKALICTVASHHERHGTLSILLLIAASFDNMV